MIDTIQVGYDRMDLSPFRLAIDGEPESALAPAPARSPSEFEREVTVRGILKMLKKGEAPERQGHQEGDARPAR